MKKKRTLKLILKRLILLLAIGAVSNAYSQIIVDLNISNSISAGCYSCATGDSIDLNNDTITDLYVKIQQWQVGNGPHHNVANALIIWGAGNDSVYGGCYVGGKIKTLSPGDSIDASTDWEKLTHPFYIEPGMPWTCSCNCSSKQIVYVGVRYNVRNGDTKYGCLKIEYDMNSYNIMKAAYITSGSSLTIPINNF